LHGKAERLAERRTEVSKRKYLDVETLKQHLFMEAALGYIKTLADVSRVIDALPEADPQEMASQLWRDAKKDPPAPMMDVVAYCADGSILTAFRYESGDWAESSENLMLDDVTHWMPNITGPELEEKNNE
jgi:hypothetical protein